MTLYPSENLRRRSLQAEDGEIGRCNDFLFEEKFWIVRYAVADTRKWLPGRKVVVSTVELGHRQPVEEHGRLQVKLTKEQIKESPPLEEHAPVSKLVEERLIAYYGWPSYWEGGGLWGASQILPALPAERFPAGPVPENTAPPGDEGALQSAHSLVGSLVTAAEEEVGNVEDCLIDTRDWTMPFLALRLSGEGPTRTVVVPTTWVEEIGVVDRHVKLRVSGSTVAEAPDYASGEPTTAEQAERWHRYFRAADKAPR